VASDATHLLVEAGNAACWGVVVLVWVVGALYNAFRAPRTRVRSRPGANAAAAVAAWAIVVLVGYRLRDHLAVDALWVRLPGLCILVAATVFTLWARLTLGTMWSIESAVKDDHRLRTGGPYAVTRHPIYTGLLAMLLGTTLLSGIGQWIVLVPAGLIVAELKLRAEERLMLATFPDEYPRYRGRVPGLVPGLSVLRRRAAK
jgi:protein-S-isoprenylcysteine O-methyltransferase Ste14